MLWFSIWRMRSRVMPYSCPIASSVLRSPFPARPKRSVSTRRERSGSPARRSFVAFFGEKESILWLVLVLFDRLLFVWFTLYQIAGLESSATDCPHVRHILSRKPAYHTNDSRWYDG